MRLRKDGKIDGRATTRSRRSKESYLPKTEEAREAQRLGRIKGAKKAAEVQRLKRKAELVDLPEPERIEIASVTPKAGRALRRASLLEFSNVWRLDNGKSLGESLEPFQRAFLVEAAREEEGLPRYRRILCSLPRQSGKTEKLACYGAWRTITVGDATLSTAVDLDQSRLQFDRLLRAMRRSPILAEQFDLSATKGTRINRADGGAYWQILPSDEASAGGHVCSTLLVDEVVQFRSGSWGFIAQVSPSPSVPQGQTFFAGFKGGLDKRVKGAPLYDLSEQAAAGAPDLYALIVEGRSPASWHTDRFLDEQRRVLPRSVFEQLYMNRWSESEDQFLLITMVEGAVDQDLDRGGEADDDEVVVLGLDIGMTDDATALSAVALRDDGARLIRQEIWQGSRDVPVDLAVVEAAVEEWYCNLDARLVVLDPWQGQYVAQRLSSRGMKVEIYTFTAGSVERLAAGIYHLFSNRMISIPDDSELKSELLGLTTRKTTGGYKWVHPSGAHDDRVVSLALGCSPLFQAEIESPPQESEVLYLDGADADCVERLQRFTGTDIKWM